MIPDFDRGWNQKDNGDRGSAEHAVKYYSERTRIRDLIPAFDRGLNRELLQSQLLSYIIERQRERTAQA